jgi:hypothetical protein
MTQLMAGRVLQPGPVAGAGQDLIGPSADSGMPRRGPFSTTNTRSVPAAPGRSSRK